MVYCPNCGKENIDQNKYCDNCGKELNQSTITNMGQSSDKQSKGFQRWWNQQSTNRKAVIGIGGVCCIGLILLVLAGGIMAPDKTTTDNSKTDTSQVTNNQTNTSKINDGPLSFELPSGWTEDSTYKNSPSFKNTMQYYWNDLLDLSVIKYPNKKAYDKNYTKDAADFEMSTSKTKTMTIEGVEIKFINTTFKDDNTVIGGYFFEKNGGFYSAFFTDKSLANGYSESQFAQQINEAISSIVKTIN